MSNEKIIALLKKQEEDRQDLAAGVYQAWQSIRQSETQVLTLYNNVRENIPAPVREKMDKARADFFEEWGSEGRLAALMAERHAKERDNIAEPQRREDHSLTKNRERDRGR